MATCTISHDDFVCFLGPKVRNNIKETTRQYKKNAVCDCCGKRRSLQSAHLMTRKRNDIIKECLERSEKVGSEYSIEIEEMVHLIEVSHYPISETCAFLCKECHGKYDNEDEETVSKVNHAIYRKSRIKSFVEIKGTKLPTALGNETSKDYLFLVMGILVQKLSPKDIGLLQDQVFCRKVLGLGHPVLTTDPFKVFDANGRRRYYKDALGKYFLCMEWKKENFPLLARMLNDYSIKYSN